MAANEDLEQRVRGIQRQYVGFLDDAEQDGKYEGLVNDMIASKMNRLIININDLRKSLPDRAKTLMENAFDDIIAMQRALKEVVGSIDPSYAKEMKEFHIGFEGSFGARHVTARTLTSKHINNLVCIEGIVTKVSLVRPKVTTSVHYCPATTKSMERNYSDLTSLDAFPSTSAYPTQDDDGNPLQTEFGLSTYKDNQTLTLHELPEKAPTGQLPRAIDAICEYDLVDRVKPGDRVQLVARYTYIRLNKVRHTLIIIVVTLAAYLNFHDCLLMMHHFSYRCLPGKTGGFTNGTFKTILLVNNLISKTQEEEMNINGDDVQKCKKLSKQKKNTIFDLLSKSLAPSIHGHDYVKKALLCLLLGGIEKILPNGTRLRGDINVLLIGDPR